MLPPTTSWSLRARRPSASSAPSWGGPPPRQSKNLTSVRRSCSYSSAARSTSGSSLSRSRSRPAAVIVRSSSDRCGIGAQAARPTILQRFQERDEVGLLPRGQADVEASVVEIDRLLERGRRAVVKIRRPSRECAEDRALELADVSPSAGHHRATRIGG